MVKKLLNHTHRAKFCVDLLIAVTSVFFAFYLRVDRPFPHYLPGCVLLAAVNLVAFSFIIYFAGLTRQSWRKVGVKDLSWLINATLIGTLCTMAVSFLARPYTEIPRSIPTIAGMLILLGWSGVRLLYRLYHEHSRFEPISAGRRVLIAGAGEAGILVAKEMLRHPASGLRPVGFLDDAKNKQRMTLAGIKVLGTLNDLPRVVQSKEIDEVIIAIPSAQGQVVRKIIEFANEVKVKFRIVPGIYDLISGKATITQIREVDVEDLLRRKPVELELGEIARYLQGRVVMISGAGGSIGREIVNQVCRFEPRRLILLGRGENSLFEAERELELKGIKIPYRTLVVDIRDEQKLRFVFQNHHPQVIFHAAANKHVPMMEANPDEAILNNVGGTQNLLNLALEFGVERFVNISTDKAVNPTSVMGATKRIAEMLVQHASSKAASHQSFVSVRFGNVLGSRGSVIPVFKEQIRRRAPILVTHPEMSRYFMTITEASQLVLQAGGLGDNGSIYILDMGQAVKIIDLAKDLIRLSGLELDLDIKIEIVGPRPGEKLFEELMTSDEQTLSTKHEKISVAPQRWKEDPAFPTRIKHLLTVAAQRNPSLIRSGLKELIPTYVTPQWGAVVAEIEPDSASRSFV